jgi:hypothetical protein
VRFLDRERPASSAGRIGFFGRFHRLHRIEAQDPVHSSGTKDHAGAFERVTSGRGGQFGGQRVTETHHVRLGEEIDVRIRLGPQIRHEPLFDAVVSRRWRLAFRFTWSNCDMIARIVSGGQNGVDFAALDVARRHDFPHSGWCPKGRRSPEGSIPAHYPLQETISTKRLQSTEWNVRDSDGTAVFTLARTASGGSLETIHFAMKYGKPLIQLSQSAPEYTDPALLPQRFIAENGIAFLNVAGSSESNEPGFYRWVSQILEDAFFWSENHPNHLGGPGEG